MVTLSTMQVAAVEHQNQGSAAHTPPPTVTEGYPATAAATWQPDSQPDGFLPRQAHSPCWFATSGPTDPTTREVAVMTAPSITLQGYEQAERLIAHEEARAGLTVHGIITLLVSALLIVINVTVAEEFPWSAFAVGGMTIGLAAHWWFGYRHLDNELAARQHKVEERAAHLYY
jgi:hypothetical protein